MNISPVANINYTNSSSPNAKAPAFKSVIKVSDVIWNDRPLIECSKYKSIIDKAVKMLKYPADKSAGFVKNFWSVINNPSRAIQRSHYCIIQGKEAEQLAELGVVARYTDGDIAPYTDAADKMVVDLSKRFKSKDGKEQQVVIRAHEDKKRRIIIDDLFFKPYGEKLNLQDHPAPVQKQEIPKAPAKSVKQPEPKLGKIVDFSEWPAVIREDLSKVESKKKDPSSQHEFDFD